MPNGSHSSGPSWTDITSRKDIEKMIESAIKSEKRKVIELETQLDLARGEVQRLNKMVSDLNNNIDEICHHM